MQHELATFALIVASISSFAVAGSFFLNWRAKTEETKIRYVELINKFATDLGSIANEGFDVKTKIEFVKWSTKYLQKCETIAHLIEKEKIHEDITTFFEPVMHDGYNGMKWLDKKYSRTLTLEQMCTHLKTFVDCHPVDEKLTPKICMIEGVYNTVDKKIDWEDKL